MTSKTLKVDLPLLCRRRNLLPRLHILGECLVSRIRDIAGVEEAWPSDFTWVGLDPQMDTPALMPSISFMPSGWIHKPLSSQYLRKVDQDRSGDVRAASITPCSRHVAAIDALDGMRTRLRPVNLRFGFLCENMRRVPDLISGTAWDNQKYRTSTQPIVGSRYSLISVWRSIRHLRHRFISFARGIVTVYCLHTQWPMIVSSDILYKLEAYDQDAKGIQAECYRHGTGDCHLSCRSTSSSSHRQENDTCCFVH